MKTTYVLFICLLFTFSSCTAQKVFEMPKPNEVSSDYKKEYKELLKEYKAERPKEYGTDSEPVIRIPIEETVPVEKFTDFRSADFTNWSKPTVAPGNTLERILAAAKYKVYYYPYDTGVDEDHPDLRVGKMPTKIFNSEPGTDRHGHGSHVLGITLGQYGGIVYELTEAGFVKHQSNKVLDGNGSGNFTNYANALNETYKAQELLRSEGAFIVTNSSLGYSGDPITYVENALKKGYALGGVTHVAAAGNTGGEMNYPGSSFYTLSSGALDKTLGRASYSSKGPELDNIMPGSQITSTWKDGNYATISGTSMAAPALSAFCIAAYAVHGPKLAEPGAMTLYAAWLARDLGETGRDDEYGYGMSMLDKIPDHDPEDMPRQDPPDDEEPTDPPTDDKEYTVSFHTGNHVMRWKKQSWSGYQIIIVPDMNVSVTGKGTPEEVADDYRKYIKGWFNNRAVVVTDEMHTNDAVWWTGQFLEYVAKNEGRAIQVSHVKGIDESGREFYETGFDKASSKSEGVKIISLNSVR